MSGSKRYPADVLINEAASLYHIIGGVAKKHMIIVGGLVPPLLVPKLASEHAGSSDIDFCLSLAFVKGDTKQYYKSVEDIISQYFEPISGATSLRWVKRDGAPGLPKLELDFLSPYPRVTADREKAAKNKGASITPFEIAAGDLIDTDAVTTTIDVVRNVYHPGMMHSTRIKHAGPVGFLAAKADALGDRDKPKDGYDVAWWCMNAEDTREKVVETVVSRPAFRDATFLKRLEGLREAFLTPESPGPWGYSNTLHPLLSQGDAELDRASNYAHTEVLKIVRTLEESFHCQGSPVP